jgi:hypothetical protein
MAQLEEVNRNESTNICVNKIKLTLSEKYRELNKSAEL